MTEACSERGVVLQVPARGAKSETPVRCPRGEVRQAGQDFGRRRGAISRDATSLQLVVNAREDVRSGQELSRRGSEGRRRWVGEGVLRRAWGEAVREAPGSQAGQAPGAPRGSGHPCQRCPRGRPRPSLQAGHWGRWDGGRWGRREWQSDCSGSGRGAPAGSCSAEAAPETNGMWAAEGRATGLGLREARGARRA